jgi:hypothetical protein
MDENKLLAGRFLQWKASGREKYGSVPGVAKFAQNVDFAFCPGK